jgi:ABC-type Fe3+/spermidine/putrescine transport system ATPase subunit
MASIRTESLTKRYGDVIAVDQVDVAIPDGSLTAILGPSGCGKTTLLRCIAGLTMPDKGRILIDDADVTNLPPFKRKLGMVFQRPSMFPHMTVYENLAWGLQLRRWPKERIPDRVREMLALVHLEGLEERAFNQLSGGQAQRVVIARSLAPEPDLLLLDEPLSSLDAKLRDQLKLEIAEIHRETACTTLLVTHDQAEALTIADNVLLMHEGRIVQEGSPLDVYQHPRTVFSANFIGANNLLPGVLIGTGQGLLAQVEGTDVRISPESIPGDLGPGASVWVCVRADDIDVLNGDHPERGQKTVSVQVERSSMTGGTVLVEGRLGDHALRVHIGGSRRFHFLDIEGSTLPCTLGNVSLIPREHE